MLFLLVGVATQLDMIFGSNSAIREATIFFFVGNELLSISENAGRIGIPLPQPLINAVETLGGKRKHNKKKINNGEFSRLKNMVYNESRPYYHL